MSPAELQRVAREPAETLCDARCFGMLLGDDEADYLSGTDTFIYKANDGQEDSVATVTIAIVDTPPTVTSVTASPGTGDEGIGKTEVITLDFNKPVTVTGSPTLSLNDGGTASYVTGSGTSVL